MFLKGLTVGAGGYALGSFLIHPNEVLGQSIESYLEKVPMEARWKIASSAGIASAVRAAKARYDKEGPEKYNESGKQRGPVAGAGLKKLADSLGFSGNDAKSMAAIMPALFIIFNGPQQRYEIQESSVEKARVQCTNCEYWNAIQAQKITDDICSSGSHYMIEGLAKALNPKLNSTLVKARPRGDSLCEWVFELKA
jgi:hypothetical protein